MKLFKLFITLSLTACGANGIPGVPTYLSPTAPAIITYDTSDGPQADLFFWASQQALWLPKQLHIANHPTDGIDAAETAFIKAKGGSCKYTYWPPAFEWTYCTRSLTALTPGQKFFTDKISIYTTKQHINLVLVANLEEGNE